MSVSKLQRPVHAGDVVITFSDELGEWTAAQITGVDATERTVGVLDLNWSGPEPSTVADVLVRGRLAGLGTARRLPWLLPRGFRVVGNAPPIRGTSSWYADDGWDTGWALYQHRRRSADPDWDPRRVMDQVGETRLHRVLGDPDFTDPGLLHLTLTPGPATGPVVDGERLVRAYPNLVSLTVFGIMARLENAGALNRLHRLRRLELSETFGMRADEAPDPALLDRLEDLRLDSVPDEYASATRKRWTPIAPQGVHLSIRRGRTPAWVAQNAANPLRAWDGREGIPASAYAKARAAWNRTTPPILAALADTMSPADRVHRLCELGVAFAEAFDGVNGRTGFIETEERDELLDGLAALISEAPTATGLSRSQAINTLLHAVNEARTW